MAKRMTTDRIQVKQRLLLARQVMTGHGPAVLCELCGRPNATDLHEVILERDDVKGPAALKLITESPPNLQMLCNPCNIGLAKETSWRMLLLGRQILRAGCARKRRPYHVTDYRQNITPDELKEVVALGLASLLEWVDSVGLKQPAPHKLRLEAAAASLLED